MNNIDHEKLQAAVNRGVGYIHCAIVDGDFIKAENYFLRFTTHKQMRILADLRDKLAIGDYATFVANVILKLGGQLREARKLIKTHVKESK